MAIMREPYDGTAYTATEHQIGVRVNSLSSDDLRAEHLQRLFYNSGKSLASPLFRVSLFVERLYVLGTFLYDSLCRFSRSLLRMLVPSRILRTYQLLPSPYQDSFQPICSLLSACKAYSLNNNHRAWSYLRYNWSMVVQYYIYYKFSYRHYTAIRRIAP